MFNWLTGHMFIQLKFQKYIYHKKLIEICYEYNDEVDIPVTVIETVGALIETVAT